MILILLDKMKSIFMLILIGTLVAAIIAAPVSKQNEPVKGAGDTKSGANALLTRALLQALVEEANLQQYGDGVNLIAEIESLPEEAQEQLWHMLIPAGISLLSSLFKG